ncbi:hypothetical protein IG631_20027 [Alternaria alternata]|nr:hypothetical protein IG631_20027 [Alternaria alternata]
MVRKPPSSTTPFPPNNQLTTHPLPPTDRSLQLPIPPPRHPPHNLHRYLRARHVPHFPRFKKGLVLHQPRVEGCQDRREAESVCQSGVRGHGCKSRALLM